MSANIMINEKKIRTLLKKTENKFILKSTISRILKLDSNEATEVLNYLSTQGFIEQAEIDGLWQQSIRGKLLSVKRFDKEFRVDTAKKHINDLIERAKIINSSKKFPDHVACIKITSEYPIEHRSTGVHVAYSLTRKKITEAEYEAAADKLREQSNKVFGNLVEHLFYPEEAIRAFLKSGSHVLKLRQYEKDEIRQISGHNVFGEN